MRQRQPSCSLSQHYLAQHYFRRFWRLAALTGAMALSAACSTRRSDNEPLDTLAAHPEEVYVSLAKVAELEKEVERLKAENTELIGRLLGLSRLDHADQAVQANELSAGADNKAADAGLPPQKQTALAPAGPAPTGRDVVVAKEEAPRLAQPAFASASADTVFANEAGPGEIAASNVLYGVHLASYRRLVDVQEGWRKLQHENPGELGLLEPRVERVTVPEKGQFLRLIGGGFVLEDKAAALCSSLKSKGLDCSVLRFRGERLSAD